MPRKTLKAEPALSAELTHVLGSANDDILIGSDGRDEIRGGGGDDRAFGLAGNDQLHGGAGSDELHGGTGNDRLFGGADDDLLLGGTGRDTYAGGAGSDRFVLGNLTFGETVLGGANGDAAGDIDALDLSDFGQGVFVDLDGSTAGALSGDAAVTQEGFIRVRADFGSDTPGEQVDVKDIEQVTGTDYDDVLFGNQEVNILIGGDGDDILHPFSTHDLNDGVPATEAELSAVEFVDGGAGTDQLNLFGAAGQLVVRLEQGTARTFADDGEGAVADGLKLFTGIEDVNGSRFFSDRLVGDTGANQLNGNGGDDILRGRAGQDHLSGGEGSDTLFGGRGSDTLDGGSGVDVMTGGRGADIFVFNGDPFNGATPAAPEPGLILGVNAPDQIEDFEISKDSFAIDGEDFGIDAFAFNNALAADLSGDDNLLVVQDSFENARAAAQAIADNEAVTADEGIFVYFNATLGINRLVYSEDLGDGGDFSVLANLNNITGEDALGVLPDFSFDNFALV